MMRLEVAVAAPLQSTLTYLYDPEDLIEGKLSVDELVGRRVLVPLSGRSITGFVLGQSPDEEVKYRLKKIKNILDQQKLFHHDDVSFFRWISDYYQYPIGEVIALALPAGLRKATRKIIYLNDEIQGNRHNHRVEEPSAPDWLNELYVQQKLNPTLSARVLSSKKHTALVKRLLSEKIIFIKDELRRGNIGAKTEVCYSSTIDLPLPDLGGNEPTGENLEELKSKLEKHLGVKLNFSAVKAFFYYSKLTEYTPFVPQKEILKFYKSASKPLGNLCQCGALRKTRERVYRTPLGEQLVLQPRPERLTQEQQRAIDHIQDAMHSGKFSPFLLHGITGSGKTEVYLRSAEICLAQGKDILVLVPEIALATQLEAHFISRFGEKVALLHSGLSQGQRYDQWSLAAEKKVKIVIGARSAVFAPLANIGLIIVDEEHDSGFKQDDTLRYNGRDLAVLRAKQLQCCVVLGSATPSVTSYYHAQTGKYQLLSLTHRVGEAVLPSVQIIDLRRDRDNKFKAFTTPFLQELELNLGKKEQSLVLLNRRGFSSSYLCQDCGSAVECKHCKVSLTYHKKKGRLICHYCGFSLTNMLICTTCNSEKLIPMGFGTERITEELRNNFPVGRR